MRNVQKTETREERKVTREYFSNPNQTQDWTSVGSSTQPSWVTNQNQNQNQTQNWTNNTTSTNTSQNLSSDLFEDAKNHASSFFQPSTSQNRNTTNNTLTNNTVEERLNFTPVQTCKVEDIWNVEATKYTMSVPLGVEYGPEDLTITLKDRVMSILVKKEKRSEFDGSSLGYQGFGKIFTVPRDADLQGVRTTLTPEGNLKIEAPKLAQPPPAIAPAPRRYNDVPIRIEH